MHRYVMTVLVLLSLLALAGCGQQQAVPTATTAPAPTIVATTPPAQETAPSSPYPEATGYPDPGRGVYQPKPYPNPEVDAPLPEGPQFTLKTPVKATDTTVTGTGPAGVPIKLINITVNASVIGETTIAEDGTFSFDVVGQINPQNVLAIKLGTTDGTDINPRDFLRGPGYEDMPMIGIVFVKAVVEAE